MADCTVSGCIRGTELFSGCIRGTVLFAVVYGDCTVEVVYRDCLQSCLPLLIQCQALEKVGAEVALM